MKMRIDLNRNPVLVVIAFVLVGGAVLISSAVSSASGSDGKAGKDMSEFRPHVQTNTIPKEARVPKPVPFAAPAPGSGPVHGIVENSQAPFPAGSYRIENQWQELIDGQWVQVYAGSLYADPREGVILVVVSSADWSSSTLAVTYKAGTVGALKIVAAKGTTLSIQSSGGATLRFDARARAFV
jgi:hypothetical protein